MESALLAKKKAQECVEASAEKEDLDGLEMEGEEEEPGEEDPEGRATHLQREFFVYGNLQCLLSNWQGRRDR